MARATHFPKYKRNKLPARLYRRPGRKQMDEQTGFASYEGRMVVDDFGVQVDGRKNGFDVDYKQR